MKLNKKYLAGLGVTMLLVGISSFPSHAQRRPGIARPGGNVTLPALLENLNLTAGQGAQIDQIRANHSATLQNLLSQLQTTRQDLVNTLFTPGALSSDQVATLTAQLSDLTDILAQERINIIIEARDVLTADQLSKARELLQQMLTQRSSFLSQVW